jgi:hypothetical protein
MGDMHGQGGLSHPTAARNGRHHHRRRSHPVGVAGQQGAESRDHVRPAGEVSDVGGQQERDGGFARRHQLCPVGTTRGGVELQAGRSGQGERVGQQAHRVQAGLAHPSALQLADGARADPRPLGELLLG